jgi:hypothetical protein
MASRSAIRRVSEDQVIRIEELLREIPGAGTMTVTEAYTIYRQRHPERALPPPEVVDLHIGRPVSSPINSALLRHRRD